MKLTGGDTKDLITWGAGGLVAAVVYQMAAIFVKQKTNVQDLDPTTEALCEDQELFALFCQLQEYRKIDESLFRKAVDSSDRLVFLHKQLRDKEVIASLRDRPNAFIYLTNSSQNLVSFFEKSKSHSSARVPVEVHRLYELIFMCLETHWKGVMHLTQSIQYI